MSTQTVARRYARAIFELAQEKGNLAETTRDVRSLADLYEGSTDFRELELNPAVTEADRVAVVKTIAQQLGVGEDTVRTASMLAERQRLSVLPDLARMVEELADDTLGVARATVTSARPLSASYREQLKTRLEGATGRKLVIDFHEDPGLIGGVVAQIGDRLIDGSVRGRINLLAESLRQA